MASSSSDERRASMGMRRASRLMTVEEFLRAPHRPPHAELVFGFMRAAVPPLPEHVALVERVRAPLAEYLGDDDRGDLFTAPIDVVLDERARIVLRPPLVAVLAPHRSIVRSRTCLWGAPDLVVEVLTAATARRMHCSKLRWYRQGGVKECWLLDTRREKFEVLNLEADHSVPHVFSGRNSIRSHLMPTFCLEVGRLFRGSPRLKRRRRS